MNPNESLFLQSYGEGIAANTVLSTVLTILYGFYLILFPFSVFVLLRSNNKSRAMWIMFLLTVVLFGVISVDWATGIALNILLVRKGLVEHPEMPLLDRFQVAAEAVEGVMTYEVWPIALSFSIGDILLTWRVWALFSVGRFSKLARYFLLVCLIAGIGTYLASSALSSISPEQDNIPGDNIDVFGLRVAALCLSLFTNVFATSLIAYKAYIHRKDMEVLSHTKRISPVGRILNYLVESGAILVLLQVVVVALNSLNVVTASGADIASRVITQAVVYISAFYPSLLIIIVSRNSRSTTVVASGGTLSTFVPATLPSKGTNSQTLQTISSSAGREDKVFVIGSQSQSEWHD